jgi:8-oxo-dGTP pyrophosphatase MutT (NUDIX family)
MTRVRRDSARVIVIDRAGRVLLLSGDDPHTPDGPFWLTPGGGTEPGESLLDTAVRELREATSANPSPSAKASGSGGARRCVRATRISH